MTHRRLVVLALLGSASALACAGLAAGSLLARAAPVDPCAMPAGVSTTDELAVRHAMACVDLRFQRISLAEYRATLHELYDPPKLAPSRAPTVWASRVRAFSSQYTATSWSAQQVLGPPDVYPATGDNPKAWASLGADDRREWIEVAFDEPHHISGVEILETLAPGAVDRVTLITESGRTVEAPLQSLRAFACTRELIRGVRVELDSPRVAGWNELDAIGVTPCQ